MLEHVWNVLAYAQKPDLVFQRNGRVHLNRRGFSSVDYCAAEVCASEVVMLDTPCSEVQCKTTGYPLHSHVYPSLPLPCVTVCHQVSTELYHIDPYVKIHVQIQYGYSKQSWFCCPSTVNLGPGKQNVYELCLKEWIRNGLPLEFQEKNVYIYIYIMFIWKHRNV